MRKDDSSEIEEKQIAEAKVLTEKLHVPFTIDLSILPAQEAPGPVWLNEYDPQYLLVKQSGYRNDYEGNQSFWVEFEPIKTGQTQVGFVQRPRMINPLYIGHPYTISIVEE
jgi:hypothetical protein